MATQHMAALGEIARATRDNPKWRHPSGVNAFYTIIHHGPTKIRTQLQEWGLRIFGDDNTNEAGFKRLDLIFRGLSSTDTAEYIMREVQRRLQEAMTKPTPKKAAAPPPISFASLGPGTPALPPVPRGNNGTTPLGPYRKNNNPWQTP